MNNRRRFLVGFERAESSPVIGSQISEAGNVETFEAAREKYLTRIFAYVAVRVRPLYEAEDIASEVFCEAYSHWKRKRGPAEFWLIGIARRKVADWNRKNAWQKHQTFELDESLRDGQKPISTWVEDRIEAERLLQALTEEEREAFLLQVADGFSITEISNLINRSYDGTNSLLQRARQKLNAIHSDCKN